MATYDKLATTTLGSNTAQITFSSIDQTYTDLVLIINYKLNAANGNVLVRCNGDTGNNYNYNTMYNNGASVGSGWGNAFSGLLVGGVVSNSVDESVITLQLQSYANTATYKTGSARGNDAVSSVDRTGCMWKSTAAINSLTILNNASNQFLTNSMFTLYGIKAA